MSGDFTHPASRRVYRHGDPAHRFAVLAAVLAEEARRYLYEYGRHLEDRDYLGQVLDWPSDPDRVARSMAHTIAELDKAYTAVTVDRDLPSYGIGARDSEWQRKYGEVT